MPGTFTIDGREVPFEDGDTIIKACHRVGIDVPHYCWHPGLSAPANCRMCLVEVEPPPGRSKMMLDVLRWDDSRNDYQVVKKPKLFPACQMRCANGMVVHSDSSEVVAETRSAVQELLLLNHPVDCPICDQAGECDLQDYWLDHMRHGKRMRDEPIHKPKAVVFGETIVYDAERCIMCTRCIRVSEEVAHDPVLDMRERGNRNEIVLAQGRTLDHNYSLMTEHVCPVGALTSSHFRFKARVWFLRAGRTICQGCSTGCNAYLDYDPRDNKPYRYRPRDNQQVNKYWMCDEGMLSYPQAYQGRLLHALTGHEDAAVTEALTDAKRQLSGLEDAPQRVALLLSAEHSLEDNFALAWLGAKRIGVTQLYASGRPAGEGDDVLMSRDKNSNTAGVLQVAQELGFGEPLSIEALVEALHHGDIDYVISLGSNIDVDASVWRSELTRAKGSVAICSHEGALSQAADIALPATCWAEAAGSYINKDGLLQQADAVLQPQGDAYPSWQLVVALGRALGFEIDWRSRADLDMAMAAVGEGMLNEAFMAADGAQQEAVAAEEVHAS